MKRTQDERVIQAQRKIVSEAYALLLLFLLVSALFKQLVLKASFTEYLTEIIGVFGASVYMMVRNLSAGNAYAARMRDRKSAMLSGAVVGIVILVVTFANSFSSYSDAKEMLVGLLASVVSGVCACLATMFAVDRLAKRRIAKLERKMDEEENSVDD